MNNYIDNEVPVENDLRVLAQDAESSMHALSEEENACFQDALNHYEPSIKAAGIANIMDDLKDMLRSRYQENPAIFRFPTFTYPLPLEWNEFQDLEFSQHDHNKDEAIKAYAQNKDHTALRFLSAPNHLMHPLAEFINRKEMRALFVEYQLQICLFYLAAIDTESIPTNGYTIATRLDGFIEELALMGRAHNWNPNPDNREEEKDDLKRDRPSCYSGIRRRLYESVRGHALLNILTIDIINAELRDFVRKHVKDTVNESNRSLIKTAWDNIILGDLENVDWVALQKLNMPCQKKDQLITSLESKYGRQFSVNPAFKEHIDNLFDEDTHIMKFGHFLDIGHFDTENLLNTPAEDTLPSLYYWLNKYTVGLCVAAISGLIEAFVINAIGITLSSLTAIGGPIALGILAALVFQNHTQAVAQAQP